MTNSERIQSKEPDKFALEKFHYKQISSDADDGPPSYRCISRANNHPENDTDNSNISRKRGIFNQIIATCAVLLLSAGCGMPMGYSTVLLPQLMSVNSTKIEIAIDIEMGSWIASVHSLATPCGSLLSGPLADFIGRRSALLISVIPLFIGWFILALSNSVPMLIFGRFFCGFATGILAGPGQVYIAETTEPNIRSLLIGAPYVSYSSGILLVYILGSGLHWRMVALYANILPALAAMALYCIPESPVWLLRQKRETAALRALTFLRGNEILAQKELNLMKLHLEREQAAHSHETNVNILQLCCQRAAMKPLFIVIMFSLLQMFSGTYIVILYAIDIIAQFGSEYDTKSAAIWTAALRFCCALVFCVILLYMRRRTIMLVFSLGSGFCCLALSAIWYYGTGDMVMDILLTGTCLLGYILFNTPLMIMPGIMIGELFPARIRGRTAGGVFAAMNVALFLFAKQFPYLQATLKLPGVFLVFGISSFLVTVFMALYQPETRGHSLQNIEDYFNGENWLWMKRGRGCQLLGPNERAGYVIRYADAAKV